MNDDDGRDVALEEEVETGPPLAEDIHKQWEFFGSSIECIDHYVRLDGLNSAYRNMQVKALKEELRLDPDYQLLVKNNFEQPYTLPSEEEL